MRRVMSTRLCPECDAKIYFSSRPFEKCNDCKQIKTLILVNCASCKFQGIICESCGWEELESRPRKHNKSKKTEANENIRIFLLGSLIFALPAFFLWRWYHSSESPLNANLIENLRKDFPSQRNETWYHFLSVLEKNIPSVKSITFLHDGDKRTADCLTNKLVSLFSENKNLKSEDVAFSTAGYRERDYGFALEHYRSVVKSFRVLVTDLTEVPGNIARVFHSLCDEFSSDIKPSLFIFTLKYDKRTETLKPLKRAETILKEAWSDLRENEIFPLISRVVRNVVDIIPEKLASC